jgi:16S rRNA A1518/A1519 N6-dimethyltransferase RsmA/KsgA/DIM1 with predicted DNA glycosylase/AP lyase activity
VETQALAELAPVDGLRVLELGCGDGRLTWWLARRAASVVAVEVDEERLAAARASFPPDLTGKVELIAASATEVDLPPGEFELALFSWSL